MKRKFVVGLLVVTVALGVLVVKGVSQPLTTPLPPPFGQSTPLISPSPSSSPPPTPVGLPSSPVAPPPLRKPATDFSKFDPRSEPQQDWTFEQFADALKTVRARQKELKAQETDLLMKMAEKVEEKRKDLQKAEEVLKQLRSDPNRLTPVAAPIFNSNL